MGNTSNVPIDQRVQIWLELVPRLLAHLGIDHVSLLSHSAGTIYLLNTLYHCRGILHPERPYAVLLGTSRQVGWRKYLTSSQPLGSTPPTPA